MKFKKLFLTLAAAAVLVSCSNSLVEAPASAKSTADRAVAPAAAKYPSMFYRGTSNNWGTTAMTPMYENAWKIEVKVPAGSQSFKFDVYGDWKTNFGDNNNDRIADSFGANIVLPVSDRSYNIYFYAGVNGQADTYMVEEKVWSVNLAINVPAGVNAADLNAKTGRLKTKDGTTDFGSQGIYYDAASTPALYSPLSAVKEKTAYIYSFDDVVNGTRLIGSVEFTYDPVTNVAPVLNLSLGDVTDYGTVNFTILQDAWINGGLVSQPGQNIPLYDGDYHYNKLIGYTDYSGKVTQSITSGAHTVSIAYMTGSHSFYSSTFGLNVVKGQTQDKTVHIVTTNVYFEVTANVGMGNAVYITGATDWLGNWSKAYKMTYDTTKGVWTFNGKIPYNTPFKVVKAAWTTASEISTAGVTWEKGDNHAAYSDSWVGYDGRLVKITPVF